MVSDAGRTGQALLIAASGMLFCALTSAMVVRRGIATDWASPPLPQWIWLTAVIVFAASAALRCDRVNPAIALGVLLVGAQLVLLSHLVLSSIGEAFLATLIAVHAAHAAAGVFALARFRQSAALFWHFVGALWLYILVLFQVWA